MPANPASVTVTIDSAQPRERSEGLPLIIAFDSLDADTNVFKDYYNEANLQAVHGAATATGISGVTHFRQRAERVVTVKPARIAVVAQALGNAVSGTIVNAPITNTVPPVMRRDGLVVTVIPTTEDPIVTVPAAGSVLLNFVTGDYRYNAAAVGAGNNIDYSYFDMTALSSAYRTKVPSLGPVTFVTVPGLEGTTATLGDFAALAALAETMYWFLVVQMPVATTKAQDKAFRIALASSHAILVKSKDGDIDLAAAIAGIGSRTNPFISLAYQEIRGISTDYFLDTDIGDVDTADTYEGEGINVVHRIGGKDVLVNERTAVAYTDDSDEIYASRVLAKIALRNRLAARVAELLVREGVRISNSAIGIAPIHTELVAELESMVANGDIRRGYSVVDPPELPNSGYASSTANAKRRRVGPWRVGTEMIESAHEVQIEVSLEVAA